MAHIKTKAKQNLYCHFDIGSPDAIQKIIKSRLLSAQKKDDHVAFNLDQKRDKKQQP